MRQFVFRLAATLSILLLGTATQAAIQYSVQGIDTPGPGYISPWAINNHGEVVGLYHQWDGTGYTARAFHYDGTTMTDLGDLGGGQAEQWTLTTMGKSLVGHTRQRRLSTHLCSTTAECRT